MREQWARYIALLTGVLVILLAALFAMKQVHLKPPSSTSNKTADSVVSPSGSSEIDIEKRLLIETGLRVFKAQGCMRCHSIGDKGNPSHPLDGVSKRRNPESIQQWILAPDEIKNQLSAGAFQAKQAYHNLSHKDLDALIAYLMSR